MKMEVIQMMKNKKRNPKLFTATVLFLTLLIMSITPILAESAEDEGMDAIAITVIVPPLSERPATTTASPARRVFPVNVAEGYNYEGVRELVRIYELLSGESPEWINTDSFTRNGYYYQLADIVRRVDVSHSVREHTEVVEIPSETNDLSSVIAGLSPTLDFADENGYVGMLHLDIRSIEMTQDGTRSTSRTVSQTREYPHLSSPDLSLIPQTITVSGRTYTFADINWRTNTANPIDFNSVAQTFTAVVTYTRNATSTVSTGYTTRAEYSGILTCVSSGDVRFAATFIGTPIVSPIVNRPMPNTETEVVLCDVPTEETIYDRTESLSLDVQYVGNGSGYNGDINGENNTEPTIPETETVQKTDSEPKIGFSFWLLLPAFFIIALIIALAALLFSFKKKADALEQKTYEDSANALSSRMAQIIHQDRTERAEANGEYEFNDSDDDNYKLDDLDSFTLDEEENFNEDGEDDV
jgi:hypothetical protein